MHINFNILQLYNQSAPTVKASLWFVTCSVIQKGLSFITVPVFTSIMPEEEYGYFSLFQSWLSVILIFSTLNLHYQVYNNGALKFQEHTNEYVTSLIGLSWMASCILFSFFCLFYRMWTPVTGMPLHWMLYMFLECTMMMPYNIFLCRERMSNSYKAVVITTLISVFSATLFGLYMVATNNGTADSRLLAIVICDTIIGIVIFFVLFPYGKTLYNKTIWKYSLRLAVPLLPHYLANVILTSLGSIMIARYCGGEKLALYTVAYSLGMIMQIVVNSVNAAINPWIYRTMNKRNYSELKKGTSILYVIMAVLTILPTLVGTAYIHLFMKATYYEAESLIGVIAASSYFTYVYSILLVYELYFEKTRYTSIASVIAAVGNIVFNYCGIQIWGYQAVAYVTLICYILLALVHYYFLNKICIENQLFISRIIDIKLVTTIGIFVCILAFVISSFVEILNFRS
ncbi:lipopolysaccharide biosynthesis protein [uncultured Mitsuokella sp.]|uniref:lipopolysaccharide biosynthesis protein n=1 Tax=uncultured Mitsuokella sp. TaxID=453120 RepID=UPI002676DA67|nr:oligosaccharide flippase family protein [uncultured Mitsuokella sp.]